ncbi:MAG: HD family phosphohydrolase [Planctomycetota bacterium]|jgi:putative nucleotidyltransferase with HDIG domain
MGLIGDGKKRKSWQQLSFGRQQTKTGALEQERASSRRVLRLGYVLLHILFVSGLIILDRFVGPVPLSPEQMIEEGLVLFGMVLLIHGVMVSVIRSFHPEVLEGRTQLRQFALILAGTLAVARVLVYHDWIPSPYLVPFPLVAMTIALIHSARFAVHAMAGILVMFGLMLATDQAWAERALLGGSSSLLPQLLQADVTKVVVTQFIGCIVAILGVKKIRTRTRLVTIGLKSGGAQVVTVLALHPALLMDLELLQGFLLSAPVFAALNGIVSGILITSALPWIEGLFDVTTDMRLIELADTNRDLLRNFALLAPGSFQHSLMVGQLAEVAASSIGANSLLVRVGALYHDIGKMKKPNYFVENMEPGDNIHDRLSPEMSRLVVISHVKDGIGIAREEKLPRPIIDMIPMHHGTSVVEFFFNKMMRKPEASEERDEQKERTREAFRYPGPKPTFREAGILMLADSVEASARVLSDPTPTRIRQHVRKIIHMRMSQGELDDCELTMRDLARIEDAFVRVLGAIHHGRIKYPDGDAKTEAPPAPNPAERSGGAGGARPVEESAGDPRPPASEVVAPAAPPARRPQ